MARSDLILTLVRAGIGGDKTLLRSTVEAMAADERAKNHNTLADRLTKAVQVNGHYAEGVIGHTNGAASPGKEFIAETVPQRTLNDLVLNEVVQTEVANIVEEQHRADLLRAHGIQPRHRVLLSGPPGNGKTALAEAMAEALAVPYLSVRYDSLIGSFLGETTQRLRKLFDYVKTTPCVLLFDEFDAVGKERGDVHETGEIKRVVSSLLLQIDALPSYVVVVAATNHAELLDRAVWRRFQLRLAMPSPSVDDLHRFLVRSFASLPDTKVIDTRNIANTLWPLSYAECSEFLIDVRRRHVLSLGQKRFADIVREQLPLWSARGKVLTHGDRSDETIAEVRPACTHVADTGFEKSTALPKAVRARKTAAGPRTQAQRAGKSAAKRG